MGTSQLKNLRLCRESILTSNAFGTSSPSPQPRPSRPVPCLIPTSTGRSYSPDLLPSPSPTCSSSSFPPTSTILLSISILYCTSVRLDEMNCSRCRNHQCATATEVTRAQCHLRPIQTRCLLPPRRKLVGRSPQKPPQAAMPHAPCSVRYSCSSAADERPPVPRADCPSTPELLIHIRSLHPRSPPRQSRQSPSPTPQPGPTTTTRVVGDNSNDDAWQTMVRVHELQHVGVTNGTVIRYLFVY